MWVLSLKNARSLTQHAIGAVRNRQQFGRVDAGRGADARAPKPSGPKTCASELRTQTSSALIRLRNSLLSSGRPQSLDVGNEDLHGPRSASDATSSVGRGDATVRCVISASESGCLRCALAAAARSGEDDIDTWKGTVKGPGKMVAVDAGRQVRPRAARAMRRSRWSTWSATTSTASAELLNALQKLDAGDARQADRRSSTPGLVELMNSDGRSRRGRTARAGAAAAPDPRQGRRVRADPAAPARRRARQLTDARHAAGTRSTSTAAACRATTAPSRSCARWARRRATALVDALNAQLPQQALIKLAELIGQLGDAAHQAARGAEAGGDRGRDGRARRSSAGSRRRSRSSCGAAAAKDPARVEKAAQLNRDRFIDEGAIPAMKYLADRARGRPRACWRSPATRRRPQADRRTRALQALEGKVREEHLDALLALALDPSFAAHRCRTTPSTAWATSAAPRRSPPMWPLVQDAKSSACAGARASWCWPSAATPCWPSSSPSCRPRRMSPTSPKSSRAMPYAWDR